jgi:hypothetical protein
MARTTRATLTRQGMKAASCPACWDPFGRPAFRWSGRGSPRSEPLALHPAGSLLSVWHSATGCPTFGARHLYATKPHDGGPRLIAPVNLTVSLDACGPVDPGKPNRSPASSRLPFCTCKQAMGFPARREGSWHAPCNTNRRRQMLTAEHEQIDGGASARYLTNGSPRGEPNSYKSQCGGSEGKPAYGRATLRPGSRDETTLIYQRRSCYVPIAPELVQPVGSDAAVPE